MRSSVLAIYSNVMNISHLKAQPGLPSGAALTQLRAQGLRAASASVAPFFARWA